MRNNHTRDLPRVYQASLKGHQSQFLTNKTIIHTKLELVLRANLLYVILKVVTVVEAVKAI